MRRAVPLSLFLLLALGPGRASAYAWMIRHGQTGCAACHVDPSGAGILTVYGRAQSQLLLPPRGADPENEEVSATTGFFFGLFKLPEWFNLGFSFRGGGLVTKAQGESATIRPVVMITDLRMAIDQGPFQAVGTLGYAIRGALPAAITGGPDNNLVSREHWVGLSSEDESIRVRAGRMNLPYGLRIPEHTAWVRQATRTDINEQQQHGLAVSYAGEQLRGELMAILGNFQLRPSVYHERGAAGSVEWAPTHSLALGVSALVTHALYSIETQQPSVTRHAYGLFGRWAPIHPLVLLVEGDVLLQAALGAPLEAGGAALVQLDYELIQGIHLIGTGELLNRSARTHWGSWLSFSYFCLPQLEIRLDGALRNLDAAPQRLNVFSLLAQLHLSL